MKVVILCGGQGTRLREETEYTPKPLVPVGGRPILWHIMKLYAHYGFDEFVLCLGYRGNMIKEYFLNYEAMNNDFTITLGRKNELVFHKYHDEQSFKVTLADTGSEAMTGSRLKQVQHYIDTETFMLTYGDGLCDVNLKKLVDFHQSHGRLATVTAVQPVSRFGAMNIGADCSVENFAEKPQSHDWVSAGFFVFNHSVFNYLSPNLDCILEREPLERLTADGQLAAFHHDGFFYAMDTYREYLHLNELWKKGVAPWAIWENANVEPVLL